MSDEQKTAEAPENTTEAVVPPADAAKANDAIKVDLDKLQDTGALAKNQENTDVILEIPVRISLEVGSAKLSIRNLLKLSQGSIVELDRFAGDPLDVFVNGTLIAHGEVVVVNEKFGIRLTDVISQTERIQKLGEQN